MDLKNLDKEHGLAEYKWLSGSVAAAALKGDAYLCLCIPGFREAWDRTGQGTIARYIKATFGHLWDVIPAGLVRAGLCLWGSRKITSGCIAIEDREALLREDIMTLGNAILDGTITLEMIQAEIKRRIGGYYDDQE